MSEKFTRKTFQYFDKAEENSDSKKWFEVNKKNYEANVKEPFMALMTAIEEKHGDRMPGIAIGRRKPTTPLRRGSGVLEDAVVKNFSFFTFWEKNTSRFEWNPAIHIQFGAKPDDNYMGCGIYMVSSRQLHLMRHALVNDYETLHKIMSKKRFKETWGEFEGELYKKFPKGFDEDSAGAKYLWHKNFVVIKKWNRSTVVRKDFFDTVLRDIEIVLPFFNWMRETVRTFERPPGVQYF